MIEMKKNCFNIATAMCSKKRENNRGRERREGRGGRLNGSKSLQKCTRNDTK
jgi:hypothetical protein